MSCPNNVSRSGCMFRRRAHTIAGRHNCLETLCSQLTCNLVPNSFVRCTQRYQVQSDILIALTSQNCIAHSSQVPHTAQICAKDNIFRTTLHSKVHVHLDLTSGDYGHGFIRPPFLYCRWHAAESPSQTSGQAESKEGGVNGSSERLGLFDVFAEECDGQSGALSAEKSAHTSCCLLYSWLITSDLASPSAIWRNE